MELKAETQVIISVQKKKPHLCKWDCPVLDNTDGYCRLRSTALMPLDVEKKSHGAIVTRTDWGRCKDCITIFGGVE